MTIIYLILLLLGWLAEQYTMAEPYAELPNINPCGAETLPGNWPHVIWDM